MTTPSNTVIAREILRLCALRGAGKSICPSEVARALAAEEQVWRRLMPEIRLIGHVLAEEGGIAILQKGERADTDRIKGPIRFALPGTIH